MKDHVTILGVIYIALNSIGLLVALIVFVAVTGGGIISQDPNAMRITAIVGTAIAAFFVLFSLPGVLAGLGLIWFKPWGRILALVLAVLNIVNVPFGTALAVYSFWVLLNDETSALFSTPAEKRWE